MPPDEPGDEVDASGEDADDPLIGTLLADRYRIERLLGIGGMGKVYRAEHVHMRKPMAIKVLHPQMKWVSDVVARFEREAIAAGRIEHPNVAAATDFGQLDDGAFYMVMEYLEGHDLADLLAEHGHVTQRRAVRIGLQIAEALSAAHEAGVVHRDLKPENVFLLERPDEPEFVKVLDFGIAKINLEEIGGGEQLTKMGTVFGTPQYMAPEQAAGKTVDHRADLYTVGVLLYEMVQGRQPFNDDDMVRVLSMQIESPPPPLPEWVDPVFSELIMRTLSKDPDDRPQSAGELAGALRGVLERMPDSLAPPAPLVTRAEMQSQVEASTVLDMEAPKTQASPDRAGRSGRVQVPVWALVVSAIALIAVVGVVVGGTVFSVTKSKTSGTATQATPASASGPVPKTPPEVDPGTDELAARAATGDQDAIAELERRPEAERTADLWLALGRGRTKLGDRRAALDAYSKALAIDSSLKKDRTLLRHVHRAAREEETAEDAIRIAAKDLGAEGADLLYDVWVATRAKTTTTQLAKQLVYSEDIRKKASPALNIALDLREADSCQAIKELLPRATLNGDTRSLRILHPLKNKKGCGAGKKEDCNPCLREGTAFEDALQAVRSRPAPRF